MMTKQIPDRPQLVRRVRKTQRQRKADAEAVGNECWRAKMRRRFAGDPELVEAFVEGVVGSGELGAEFYRSVLRGYLEREQVDGSLLVPALERRLAKIQNPKSKI